MVNKKSTTLKRIWGYIGKYKALLVFVFICAIVGNSLAMLAPLMVGNGIDKMLGESQVDFTLLRSIIIKLIMIYFISALFQWLLSVVSTKVANEIVKDIRKDAFHKLNKLPLRYYDNSSRGDVISRLTNDVEAISEGLFQGTTQIMSGIIIIIGCFVFMLTISVRITCIIVLLVPVCYAIAATIAKKSATMFQKRSQSIGQLNGYAEEMISNIKVVKAFGYEDMAKENFSKMNEQLYVYGQKAQWYSSLTNPTTRYVNNLGYVAVTVIGGFLALSGGLSVGNISSFLTYSNQFAKPINEITSIMTQLQEALASAKRVFQLIDEEEESDDSQMKNLEKEIKGEVVFEHVDFSYREGVELIKDLNLKVSPGNMVAIVGPTGAGKSTLVNLLMRFYDVNQGAIYIDGTDIREIKRDDLRSRFGMVLQESWLFKGTVEENIGYGSKEVSMEQIMYAAKKAHAHSFIKRLKDGYDTMIEEDAGNISQGQKQLLTIARAMLLDPPILILDEATSSIDTRTELKIQKAFHAMMQGRTSFVIAHRLSTIEEADVILVMKDGNIIEQGTHTELLKKKGFYHTLYHSQFAKEK